jgi:glycosyltransferase involved in cell wall biosynthesis
MRVSVVIPTYSGERFIREALDSVLAQTLLPCEMVVVDDCSRDHTCDVVESAAAASPVPIRLIKLPKNSGGPGRPINVGVAEVQSDLVAVLDQDDVYEPHALGRACEALAAEPKCGVAFHWFGVLTRPQPGPRIDDALRQRLLASGADRGTHRVIPGSAMLAELVQHNNFLGGYPGFVFRRSMWEEKGGVDESLRIAGDTEFLGWLFQQGPVALVPEIGYRRRVHDSNACGNVPLMFGESIRVIARLLQTSPDLREASAVRASAIAWIREAAYWFRQGQAYEAAALAQRVLAELGADTRLTSTAAMVKLQLHRALTKLTGRKPTHYIYTNRPHANGAPLQQSLAAAGK